LYRHLKLYVVHCDSVVLTLLLLYLLLFTFFTYVLCYVASAFQCVNVTGLVLFLTILIYWLVYCFLPVILFIIVRAG